MCCHFLDVNNTIWFAYFDGIRKYQNQKLIYNSKIDDNFKNRTFSILKYDSLNILIASYDGLWNYKHDGELIPKGKYINLALGDTILKTRITDIKLNKTNKNLWLATKGKGIVIYDFKNKKVVKSITTKDGLQSDIITKIYFENDNNIWIGTNQGINKIIVDDENNLIIQKYTISDGLINDIYIATNKGVSLFEQSKYKNIKFNVPIYITKVNILNNDTLLKNFYNLKYNQNSISISYTALAYRSLGKLKYKYSLQKNNEPQIWVYTNLQLLQ